MYIAIVLFILFLIGMSVAITKFWNKGAARRRAGAEAQAARHGGQFVLEWNGPRAQGAADGEFGPLLVELPKKMGKDCARFYERGLVLGGNRVPYDSLKDVVFIPGIGGGITPAQKMRNSSVLWLYRKKGSTIGLRDMSYRFDKQTMEDIQTGLGFRPQA